MTGCHKTWFFVLSCVTYLLSISIFSLSLLFNINMSVRLWNLTSPVGEKFFIGAENYCRALDEEKFRNSLKVTGTFVGCIVGLEFLIGLGIPLFYYGKGRAKNRARRR